jgi:prepilin peptidase CpaA
VSGAIPRRDAWSDARSKWLDLRATMGAVADEGPPLVVSAGVLACFWVGAREGALPAATWAALFLAAAVWWDVRALRIPNALTLPALAAAIAWAGIDGGWAGAGGAAASAGVVLALLLLPFARGWLGAGDVKACLVLAALWGLEVFLPALWWMFAVGGLMAVALLAGRGELVDLLRRWGRSAWLTLTVRRPVYVGPAERSAARTGLPFAVAMGLGAAAYGFWGWPWA